MVDMIDKTIPIEQIIDTFEKTYGNKKGSQRIVEELVEDIPKNGLKRRLFVHPLEGNLYGVTDGLHRLRALKQLGWKEVPCTIVTWKVQAKPHPQRERMIKE
jgi:ParB-like chromosome segregation protein Spo0J